MDDGKDDMQEMLDSVRTKSVTDRAYVTDYRPQFITDDEKVVTMIVPEDVIEAAWKIIKTALHEAVTDKFLHGPQVEIARWVLSQPPPATRWKE